MTTRARFVMVHAIALVWAAGSGCSSSEPAAGTQDAGAEASTSPVDAGAGEDASDPLRPQREACAFKEGAMVADTLGVTAAQRAALPIKHVIVVMKENRSFDHLFGRLPQNGQPDADGKIDGFTNVDGAGATVTRYHETTTCIGTDPPHQWDDMHLQWGGGKMDGFVLSAATAVPATDGHASMAYYDQPDLPFYYWLANTFALGDRHFPSVLSGTWANRDYVVAAQSDGIKITGERMLSSTIPLIFDKLQAAAIPWGVYTDDALPLEYAVDFQRYPFGTVAQVLDNLKNGALPAVTFVDSLANVDDEHPPADLQRGEQWTRTLLDAAFKSPQWNDMAIFFTYDEAGGFADHVPPPAGCVATDNPAEQDFNQLGIRVPLIVVSPYAKRHHVSHLVHEHTSILRFIEMMFDIPALTRRDANSDALLDMFDFASPPNLDVGTLPAAGTGLCATTTQAKAPSKGVRTAR